MEAGMVKFAIPDCRKNFLGMPSVRNIELVYPILKLILVRVGKQNLQKTIISF